MANGHVRTVKPDGDSAALFWATIGGMGLTGAVLRATVALQRTETAYFSVDTDRCSDIDELMARWPSAMRATRTRLPGSTP
jgi:decaprenylphospho-beta-D-ribofuranose 2-oxidase